MFLFQFYFSSLSLSMRYVFIMCDVFKYNCFSMKCEPISNFCYLIRKMCGVCDCGNILSRFRWKRAISIKQNKHFSSTPVFFKFRQNTKQNPSNAARVQKVRKKNSLSRITFFSVGLMLLVYIYIVYSTNGWNFIFSAWYYSTCIVVAWYYCLQLIRLVVKNSFSVFYCALLRQIISFRSLVLQPFLKAEFLVEFAFHVKLLLFSDWLVSLVYCVKWIVFCFTQNGFSLVLFRGRIVHFFGAQTQSYWILDNIYQNS